ncbi:MAG TPA: ferric reductase-like transmembrane domain-containing protein [Solirubrobacteraceae bacterium]|nr:ferric reductase-like transmembrane domain-containing protein [Solirubrobacteraceae bacterium]
MTHALPLATIGQGGKALWYLTRGTGAVTLVLLTLSLVLGVVDVRRFATPRMPRFVVDGLHRTVSLLVVLTVAIHIVTAVLDSFAPIAIVDAVVPFIGRYRPLWLGLGALAFDLLIALVITSLLRGRIGPRTWRAVHWAAYACWPLAFVHGLGTGSDIRGGWMLIVSLLCAAAVTAAILARIAGGRPEHLGARIGALGGLVTAGIAVAVWLPAGPLAKGWARRSGTPAADLPGAIVVAARSASVARRPQAPATPLETSISGRLHESVDATGAALLRFALSLGSGPLRTLQVDLHGQALEGGGLSLSDGQVTLGTPSAPDRFTGPVASLQGSHLTASLRDRTGGSRALDLALDLQVDRQGGAVAGAARLAPAGAGGT